MPAGSYPFHYGDFGDKFYFIIQGKVSILEKNDEFERLKKELEIQKHQ
jgi:CRP-like cAMP-binding protein